MINFLNSCARVAFTCAVICLALAVIASAQFPDNRLSNGYTKELNPCTIGNLTTEELKLGTCWR